MNQLLAPTHTLADSIPLGRRINEIMLEKGPAYTISAMAKRLEMNRETLRLMLKGERDIYTFELERIAADLKVPVERILQSDTAEVSRQLHQMVCDSEQDFALIEQLTDTIYPMAVGYTEKCSLLNLLAGVYYFGEDYGKSLDTLYSALPNAKFVYEKFDDPTVYLELLIDLITTQLMVRDFKRAKETLLLCDSIEVTDDLAKAILAHSAAAVFEIWDGDCDGARQKHYESMHHYVQTGDVQKMGTGYFFVAQFEYRQGNYEVAAEFFLQALDAFHAREHRVLSLSAVRDYAKLLIRQHRGQEAEDLLWETIQVAKFHADTNAEAQLLFLYAIVTQNPRYAEDVLVRDIGSVSIQKIVCQFLIESYRQRGEREQQFRYEQQRRQLRLSPIDSLLQVEGAISTDTLLAILDLCIVHHWQLFLV